MANEDLREYVHKLIDAQDDDMLEVVKDLLEEDEVVSEKEFLEDVPEAAKPGILEGLAQLDRGEFLTGEQVRENIKKKFGF